MHLYTVSTMPTADARPSSCVAVDHARDKRYGEPTRGLFFLSRASLDACLPCVSSTIVAIHRTVQRSYKSFVGIIKVREARGMQTGS